MKKVIILFFVLLLLVMSGNLYALGELTFNTLIQFIYFEELVNKEGIFFGSLIYTSFSIGLGYHFNFVPDILAPGIYGEAGGSFLTMFFSNESARTESNKNYGYGFLILGIRLYNQFRFNSLYARPFTGLRLFHENNKNATKATRTAGCVNLGTQIIYKNFCIEYSLGIPFKYPSERAHSIGIGYSFL